MPGRPPRILALAVLLAASLAPVPAGAHDVPQRRVMNAFVRIEGRRADLVVRVPLDLLSSVRLPMRGREIDLASAGPAIDRALAAIAHDVALFEDGSPLAPATARARLSLPSDRSFESFEGALAHVEGPEGPADAIYYDQGDLDAHLTYAVRSPASRFAIRTLVAAELRDWVQLAVRYLPADGREAAFLVSPLSGRVTLNPAWYHAGARFVALGIEHILGGIDHLLFLFCLVIPLSGLRPVVRIVTAFTVAHSLTLLGSAFGVAPSGAWFPPLVETAIAASILYMAVENVVGADLRRRWLLTGLFGLVHGFGFSYALKENLQFAGRHLVVSLLSFNLGIEIGQLAVLLAMLPALALARRWALRGRTGTIVLSAFAAHTAWHWMIERGEALRSVRWPRLDLLALAALARWASGIVLAVLLVRWAARWAGAAWSRRAQRGGAS